MPFRSFDHGNWATPQEFPLPSSNQSPIHIHRHNAPTLLAPPLTPPLRLTNPSMQRESRHAKSIIHRLLLCPLGLRTRKAREANLPLVQKVTHVVVPFHDPALEANPSFEPVAFPLRLAVLEARRLQQLHASRAGQPHGRFGAAGRRFEVVVEAAPGSFAEARRWPGDAVELVAHEAHVCDGGRR